MTYNQNRFVVYILASKKYGTLYIGRTNIFPQRMEQHIFGEGSKFTSKYNVRTLVYFEVYDSFEASLLREKHLKAWRRDWKIKLIEEHNPDWIDLSKSLTY